MTAYPYDAFISYSHKDMRWGRWVQERLERYRLPEDLQADSACAKTSLRIFRDQTDLAGVELQASLRRELEASRYMIVICSPYSASSPWVNDEIRYFKSLGRADCIIPFIVDGEPESGDPATECYPGELRNDEGHHFLGANIREIGRNNALLKVLSVCLGVRFDRLVDREQRRRRRNTVLAGSALFVILAVIVGLLWRSLTVAKENERIAKENEQIAQEREQIALENERIARENEALVYDDYIAVLTSVFDGSISPEGISRVEASANAGNASASFLMGYMAENGSLGNEPDPEQAFRWYLRGAEAGDGGCMAHVGRCYLLGEGVARDDAQSYAWFKRASEAGNASAMYSVGLCLESGLGTAKNESEAVAWFRKAAEGGHEDAYYKLGECYMFGNGVEQNDDEAFFWLQKFARTGDADGMAEFGICYQLGIGTEENPREAYLWYRRGAEAGSPYGMVMTGWCLEHHYGVESEAEEWYARAAASGDEEVLAVLERFQGEASKE